MSSPLAFISYRRADSSAASRWLANIIGRTFGAQSVFIDTETIRMAEDWVDRIEEALSLSTIVLPVIGVRWLEIADKYHRRRIDDPADWVHKEIAYAIEAKKPVLPLLLSRTPMPTATALPPPLARLACFRACELRDEHWERDLSTLLAELERFEFVRPANAGQIYPPPKVTLSQLTVDELQAGLALLPGWKILSSQEGSFEPMNRVELVKTFSFATFEDAIHFMNDAVSKINEMQHHPRWENVWCSVTVYLSTWDIGHRPSQLDLDLATYFEEHRLRYPPANRRMR